MKLKDIKIKFDKEWAKYQKENWLKYEYKPLWDYSLIHIEWENIAIRAFNTITNENNMMWLVWMTKECQKQILEYLQELIAEKLYELNK